MSRARCSARFYTPLLGVVSLFLAGIGFGGCAPDQYDYPVARGTYIGEVFVGDNSSDEAMGDIILTASGPTELSEVSIMLNATETSPALVLDATLDASLGGLEERTFSTEFSVDGETWQLSGAFLNRAGEDLTEEATTCAGTFIQTASGTAWTFAAIFDPTGISGDPVE